MPGEGSGLWPDAACKAGQRESPVVKSPGLHELSTRREQSFVERADLLNRPLRTRTVGGVGGWGLEAPGYHLAPRLGLCDRLQVLACMIKRLQNEWLGDDDQ